MSFHGRRLVTFSLRWNAVRFLGVELILRLRIFMNLLDAQVTGWSSQKFLLRLDGRFVQFSFTQFFANWTCFVRVSHPMQVWWWNFLAFLSWHQYFIIIYWISQLFAFNWEGFVYCDSWLIVSSLVLREYFFLLSGVVVIAIFTSIGSVLGVNCSSLTAGLILFQGHVRWFYTLPLRQRCFARSWRNGSKLVHRVADWWVHHCRSSTFVGSTRLLLFNELVNRHKQFTSLQLVTFFWILLVNLTWHTSYWCHYFVSKPDFNCWSCINWGAAV